MTTLNFFCHKHGLRTARVVCDLCVLTAATSRLLRALGRVDVRGEQKAMAALAVAKDAARAAVRGR